MIDLMKKFAREYPVVWSLGGYYDDADEFGADGMEPLREWCRLASRELKAKLNDELQRLLRLEVLPFDEITESLNYYFEDIAELRCWTRTAINVLKEWDTR